MSLPIRSPFPAMEAAVFDSVPEGSNWLYEPKWDGFRCLVFRDGDDVFLQSRNLKPLGRYFPEMVSLFEQIPARRFVLDGELVIPRERRLDFEQLQLRLHPAERRVRKLARENPAWFIAFDLLVGPDRHSLVDQPFSARRGALEAFAAENFNSEALRLSPVTSDIDQAHDWLSGADASLDGVMAKKADAAYFSGQREGIYKVKRYRGAECVIGGYRYEHEKEGGLIGSLLLGLYNDEGLLDNVGYVSALPLEERRLLTQRLPDLRGEGFTGRNPGGPSRWSSSRSGAYVPLSHVLVAEIEYDHFTGGRFRHATRFRRWRPDKDPEACTFDQIHTGDASMLDVLEKAGAPA